MRITFSIPSRVLSYGLFAFISLAFLLPTPAMAWGKKPKEDVRDALVKIYTVRNRPNYYNPWNMRGPESASGSGAVIEGNRILTNAHVVSDQTFIQVRKNGHPQKVPARVLYVSHDADLALLTVDDPSFFEGVPALKMGDMPELQAEVKVLGFPQGGDTLSTTQGVVSRIEHTTYAHSSMYLLASQLDAAINPGNSGGPVLENDLIVGVVMQSLSSADNIGYMVPIPVVKHFLDDLEDGSYDGFPGLGAGFQEMENRDLRRAYGLSEGEEGVLVTEIYPGGPSAGYLEVGDVLLGVDGQKVAGDGTVELRPKERTSMVHAVQQRQVGGSISLEIFRNGEKQSIELPLTKAIGEYYLVPMERYDIAPTYYIYGGLVFMPLTKGYLQVWGAGWYSSAPKNLIAYLSDNKPENDGEEVVLLAKVLAADLNEGYHHISYWRVTEVDGKKILNMSELIEAIEAGGDDEFIRFKEDAGGVLILDRERAAKEGADILELYRIPAERSADLMAR